MRFSIIFLYVCSIINQSFSMKFNDITYEIEEEFRDSLEKYEIGTEEHPLVTKCFAIHIEDNNLIYFDKSDEKKKEIIKPIADKITHFNISCDETKIIALQSARNNVLYHNGLWIVDLTNNSSEFKYIPEFFEPQRLYTHLAVSKNKTIAVGNDEIQLFVYQCGYPERNIKERHLFRSYPAGYKRKLISLKFNEQGTHFGLKVCSGQNSQYPSKEIAKLPDFNEI